jgi:hypothetical protein
MTYKIFHFTPEGEVFKILDNLKRFSNIPIKTMLFIYDHRYGILDILEKLKPYTYRNSSYSKILDDEHVLLLDMDIVKDSDKIPKDNGKVFFLISKKEPFGVMITNSDSKHFSKVINYFNKHYPLISRIFLRSHEIKDLLDIVEKENATIIIKNYVLKRYYVKKKVDMSWEVIGHKRLFEKATESFLWVDSIFLDIIKNGVSGKVRINRRGLISYIGLDYSMIFSLFIEKILKKYSKIHSDILIDKSRNLENLEPQAIRFFIEEDVFKSSEDVTQFLKSMHKSLHNWGYSVLFKEGSYLFVILHDYQTGSSYDLLISSPSEIFIIPQTQVTSISFNTLINFLTNTYDGAAENVQ